MLHHHGAEGLGRAERGADHVPVHAVRRHLLPQGRHLPARDGPAQGEEGRKATGQAHVLSHMCDIALDVDGFALAWRALFYRSLGSILVEVDKWVAQSSFRPTDSVLMMMGDWMATPRNERQRPLLCSPLLCSR